MLIKDATLCIYGKHNILAKFALPSVPQGRKGAWSNLVDKVWTAYARTKWRVCFFVGGNVLL